MSGKTVDQVLKRIAHNWDLPDQAEITLEANPTSVEASKFKDFAAAGVNRVSLGIQSLRDQDLKALGREHDVAESQAAIKLAQKSFPRMSFDLIYARMGQTVADWQVELQEAIDLAAGHLSLYQLTIEQGTAFYNAFHRGKLILPEEEVSAEMYELTQQVCADAGLPAYEISNHARPGQESQHNLTYWRYGEYIGVGPGAHGRLFYEGELRATVQKKKPEDWLKGVATSGHATDDVEILPLRAQAEEAVMMGLRLVEGINLEAFRQTTGHSLEAFLASPQVETLLETGFLTKDPHHLKATEKGRPLLNSLLTEILP